MTTRPSVDSHRSTDSKRLQTHGRGGAGNVSTEVEHLQQSDLVTPHLKGAVFTSGRGGSGNMTQNDPNRPDIARLAQDVDGAAPRLSMGSFHAGRGGAGNTGHTATEAKTLAEEQQDLRSGMEGVDSVDKKDDVDLRGWADKGKDFIFGRKK